MEMAVLMAYCGVSCKWKSSPSYLDAYLYVLPKTPITTAYALSARMFSKLKKSGAFEWFLETTGLSIRICADTLRENMRAEAVNTFMHQDGTFDYQSKPDHMVRLFAARAALRLHGSDKPLETEQENNNHKSLAELVMENEEQND
jgi:hypothetical protein